MVLVDVDLNHSTLDLAVGTQIFAATQGPISYTDINRFIENVGFAEVRTEIATLYEDAGGTGAETLGLTIKRIEVAFDTVGDFATMDELFVDVVNFKVMEISRSETHAVYDFMILSKGATSTGTTILYVNQIEHPLDDPFEFYNFLPDVTNVEDAYGFFMMPRNFSGDNKVLKFDVFYARR